MAHGYKPVWVLGSRGTWSYEGDRAQESKESGKLEHGMPSRGKK